MQYDENAEKYGYEGEMTPMKCDKLTAYKGDVTIPVYGTIADAEVYLKKEADEAIAELKDENATLQGANDEKAERIVELKKQVDELVIVKKSAELIFMNLLDCGLIKEWYFNGKFNAVFSADDPHLKIAELKKKLEDVQASMYCDVVDANMEIRRLKRSLFLMGARLGKMGYLAFHNIQAKLFYLGDEEGMRRANIKKDQWKNVERKCRVKAEEYK